MKKIIEFTKNYAGHVDVINDEWISGWIFNIENPESRVKVFAYIDSDLIGESFNDYERQDVSILHNINRSTGFKIKINNKYLSNEEKEIKIYAEDSNEKIDPTDELLAKKIIQIRLTDESYSNLKNAEKIIHSLRNNTDALISLNNNTSIRAKVDPGIGNIFIINGAKNTVSELFRTYELANILRKLNYSPLVYDQEDINNINTFKPKVVFFIRCALNESIKNYIQILKNNKIKIIADFDDLIFKPSIFSQIDGVRFLEEDTKEEYFKGIYKYRSMLELADLVTTSTNFLTNQAKQLNNNSLTLPNYPLTIVREKLQKHSYNIKNKIENEFIIGYYSGTLTHQADFKQCANAIAKIISKYDNAYFKIVGSFKIEEFSEFNNLNKKIIKIEFMSYEDMVIDISNCNVVIAPLEIGNEFCESKSELKFFDSALAGVPIIASSTQTYNEVIKHGVNGYLANTKFEWYQLIEEAYLDRSSLAKTTQNAKNFVEKNYSVNNQINKVNGILNNLKINNDLQKIINDEFQDKKISYKNNKKSKNKSICILLPDIFIGSGGHRKVLTFCAEHTKNGGDVEINFITRKTEEELNSIVREYYFTNCGTIKVYNGFVSNYDIGIATSWPTAYEVIKWNNVINKFYFVQDFEPYFSPMSTEYVKSLHSYRLGLNIISFGHWNSKRLLNELNLRSQIVDFPIEKEIYFPKYLTRKKQVLFYARPSQPRRLYELGLEAISVARPYLKDYEFIFFGEEIDLNGMMGVTSIGKITNVLDLANLYSVAEIGIAFSTTNPSLIPFEMLACGLPVIDVDLGYVNDDFINCDSILRAKPTAYDIAKTLVQTLKNRENLKSLSNKAIEWTAKLDDNKEFSNKILKIIGA
jgi:glycosyltransferase involved in cell wall biosynthesis